MLSLQIILTLARRLHILVYSSLDDWAEVSLLSKNSMGTFD